MDSLLNRMMANDYDCRLFEMICRDASIAEVRFQGSLEQFVRSIQSYDSKFDIGRLGVNNMNNDFPSFTDTENGG